MTRPPTWYWIVVAILLLWSLLGCWACYTQLSVTPAQLAQLPAAQQEAWTSMPAFAKIAYVVGVTTALAGALLLLLRRSGARILFVVSLIAVVVQFGWFFLGWHGMAKLGPASAGFPVIIALIGLFEIWFAGLAARRRWTN